jgi:uncharacterized membrane protein YhaH (DUF805 family)
MFHHTCVAHLDKRDSQAERHCKYCCPEATSTSVLPARKRQLGEITSPEHHAALAVVLFLVFMVIYFWPFVRILHRMGRSGWWILLFFTGPGFLIGIWVLAYTRWPAIDGSPRSNRGDVDVSPAN